MMEQETERGRRRGEATTESLSAILGDLSRRPRVISDMIGSVMRVADMFLRQRSFHFFSFVDGVFFFCSDVLFG